MKPIDTKTPVLVLNCKIGALAIMRSLGSLGIPVYGIDAEPKAPGLLSRYCRGKYVRPYDESRSGGYLQYLLDLAKRLGKGTILIPTSDELSLFVADHAEALGEYFVFPKNTPDLVRELVSKEGMYHLAGKHRVPSPFTMFPESLDDVLGYAGSAKLPIMLKGIHGNRLEERTGKKMVLVRTREELIANYQTLEDPERPNLMLQEYIPGGDDQIYIFNGYFDGDSECLAAFTGHKIRQAPIHVGCASLGVCRWNQEVADMTTGFMRAIGYKGILDIGYRLDQRDGFYKVLDINPRVGQAFRLFVAENDMDVVKALYLNLTGQEQPPIVPREGRKWVIEDFDVISSLHYHHEGTLTFAEWIKSFRKLEEGAWFHWKDPVPFLDMVWRLFGRFISWLKKPR